MDYTSSTADKPVNGKPRELPLAQLLIGRPNPWSVPNVPTGRGLALLAVNCESRRKRSEAVSEFIGDFSSFDTATMADVQCLDCKRQRKRTVDRLIIQGG
jgi:hypothetical protein